MKNIAVKLFSFLFVSSAAMSQNSSNNQDLIIVKDSVISDSISIAKSSEMLDEDLYWNIIQNSIEKTTNQEDQELFLIAEIEKLTPKEMIGFRLRTDQLLYGTYNENLWCAAYIMNGGCSDGGFEYFRCWLISKGKEVFYKAKENPDSLIEQVVKEQDTYEFEGLWYVAMNAFKNTTDKELFSYIDYNNFITNDENYPVLKFSWNVDEPKSMGVICPVLYKNLWKKNSN